MANFSHYSGNVTIILSAGFNKGPSSDINWLLSSCTCCCCVIAQISFWSAWRCEQEALGSSDLSVRPTQHWALSTGNQGITKLWALLPSPALVSGGQFASMRKRIKNTTHLFCFSVWFLFLKIQGRISKQIPNLILLPLFPRHLWGRSCLHCSWSHPRARMANADPRCWDRLCAVNEFIC